MMYGNTCIAVVAKGRSGTSAVAGVLHHLGVPMGTKLKEANRNNLKGFFEDMEILEAHEKICGENWEDPQVNITPYDSEYTDIIKDRDQQAIWGIKDPYLCFTLPLFSERLTNSQLKIITIDRPLFETAYSIISRDYRRSVKYNEGDMKMMTLMEAMQICVKYDKAKKESLSTFHGEILKIQYADITQDSINTIHKIAKFCHLPTTQAAVDFIDPKLYHKRIFKIHL